MKPATGRFMRKKRMTGHAGIVAMKRSFVTGGNPSLPPSSNRLVEAIFIHLCNKHPSSSSTVTSPGKQKKQQQSRWKTIITEYNNLRARIFNSNVILEKTNITLFNVNETTLMAWHKKKSRMEEIKTLLQGKTLPGNLSTTKFTPPTTVYSTLHSAATMVFTDPEDRTGQKRVNPPKATDPIPSTTEFAPIDTTMDPLVDEAVVKRKPSIKVLKPKPTQPTVYMHPPAKPTTVILPYGQTLPSTSSAVALPKTTFYRHKKNNSEPSTKRKKYSCRKCSQPMEAPHSQFNGNRYCPNEPGALPFHEWLQKQRDAKAAKNAKKQQQR